MGMLVYLLAGILPKVDRASMSCGLEDRIPLLDHRVIEATWSVPPERLRGDAGSKQPLRDALGRRVPLRGWAESLLDPRRLKEEGWFRPKPIYAMWARYLAGEGD